MSSPESQTAQQVPVDDAVYRLMPSPAVRGGPFRGGLHSSPLATMVEPHTQCLSPPSDDVNSSLYDSSQCSPPHYQPCKQSASPSAVMPPPAVLPPKLVVPRLNLEKSELSKYNVREQGDPTKRLIRESYDFRGDRRQIKLRFRKRKSGSFESSSIASSEVDTNESSSSEEDSTSAATAITVVKHDEVAPFYSDSRLLHPASEQQSKTRFYELNKKFSQDMTSSQIEDQCSREDVGTLVPEMMLLDDYNGPAFPARDGPRLTREQLLPATPCVTIQSVDQAMGSKLKKFCTSHPITVVRNICAILGINLGMFSTKVLAQCNPEHTLEVRTQFQQSCDENWDADKVQQVWRCESHRSHTTVLRYAQYQACTFVDSLKGELKEHEDLKITQGPAAPENLSDSDSNHSSNNVGGSRQKRQRRASSFKTIKFGTNLDLSDQKKWAPQLEELEKLPSFTRVLDEANMLSHVGHTILGMNTVQLYMKVPGSRTPGHQENNNFCSVNINIGPGDCEWFGVDNKYWGDIHALCERNGISYLFGSWWPLPDDMLAANIPVYKFTQKPGDLVFVNAGCIHWVQASGWCNNVAWNIGPFNTNQFRLGVERYEWNKLQGFKSIVPMLHLTWNLASNIQFVLAKNVEKKQLESLTEKNESLMQKVFELQQLGDAATDADRQRRIRNVQLVDQRFFDLIRTCLMGSLRSVERQRLFVRRLGKDIIYHGRNDDEVTYYCNTCDVEVFNILFVKEIDKKHMVHCIDCALKLSKSLKNIVVLEEYTRAQLNQIYDQFILKKVTEVV